MNRLFKKTALFALLSLSILFCSCTFINTDTPPIETSVPYTRLTINFEDTQNQDDSIKPCFFSNLPEQQPVRYLEESKSGKLLADSEEDLLSIVMKGYRPYFYADSQYRTLYDKALMVLNTIILNDMTDYEKVHAIYDYLIYYNEYDYQLLEEYLDDSSAVPSDDNAFGLKGIFFDNIAVCDGFSKAFSLLCGIEGIKTVRISGNTYSQTEDKDVSHAWNKVLIDEKWYVVDTTYGNLAVMYDNDRIKEYLTHAYFMVSDEDVLHTEKAIYSAFNDLKLADVKANEEYGFYEKEYIKGYVPPQVFEVEVGEEEDPLPDQKNYVFDNALITQDYFTYISQQGIKALEIKLDNPLFDENDLRELAKTILGTKSIYKLRYNVYFIIV